MGRPNVGKSSLFNRLIKKNIAITSSLSGSTRDINKQNIHLNKFDITLIDTGGLELNLKQLKKMQVLDSKSSKKANLDSKIDIISTQKNSKYSNKNIESSVCKTFKDSKKNIESKIESNPNLSNKKSQELIANTLRQSISAHSMNVIESCDIVIYLLDGNEIPSENDINIFRALSKKRPVILAINKIDSDKKGFDLSDFLSFGTPFIPISVSHNRGITKLLSELENLIESLIKQNKLTESITLQPKKLDFIDYFDDSNNVVEFIESTTQNSNENSEHSNQNEDSTNDKKNNNIISIGIIGRPNVGKSSILNALVSQNRSLVSNIAGTTIDPVSESIEYKNHTLKFIDTAGLRRRGKIDGLEKFALDRTQRILSLCDIAILVLDSSEDFCALDSHISAIASTHNLGIIVVLNKWDIHRADFKAIMESYKRRFKFLEYAPTLTLSSVTNRHINELKDKIIEIFGNFSRRIPTAKLNEIIESAQKKHPLPSQHGKIIRIYYATQFATKPPQIALIMNKPDALHFSYKRYLTNTLRQTFNFQGTPIIIESRAKKQKDSEN
ncbi:ribosome biogenesis GTPase Der [Helicobacter saguini]|uniref:GTPase Der n=2 Tax=Helicobacter saguini TaxID=1548018 RepID=A0A347W0E7_9HELI|nr:ribosome biogenesis GTPase Der [Helicobacter saguini]MWV66800.1 ribosome biogenesis GTPase Der [Helicobacter saguini]MWV69151.1 ribosome biogenesis GTPase Der [Helicobacter saguini]MWV71294.1 ribosome biogenesis GTPase Der [Helicobacter saguini]TLD94243.1 ribosome biogenesis GTPase Der [Helicobacter saguini]